MQPHNEIKREKKIPISNVCLGGCPITSKTKINVFEIFSSLRVPSIKFFLKTLIFAFEANTALSCQNGLFSVFYIIVQYRQILLAHSTLYFALLLLEPPNIIFYFSCFPGFSFCFGDDVALCTTFWEFFFAL